jgi:molecular chaperone GrpE|tara:strand:- start:4019 stop:4603 length:585 start_codon:yes stop_codon:yes gene_type:complete
LKEFSEDPKEEGEEVASGILSPGPEATEIELLQAQLEEAEREKSQFKALAQRGQADFANFRKRADEEKLELLGNAKSQVILRFLPALDDIERAMSQAPPAGSDADSGWLEGFRLIERKLNSILEGEGLQRIEAEGLAFNPWEHEIVSYLDVPGRREGEILEVTRQGYKMNGKVLRPAQVVVVKKAEVESTAENN